MGGCYESDRAQEIQVLQVRDALSRTHHCVDLLVFCVEGVFESYVLGQHVTWVVPCPIRALRYGP
jgi:hypothetical protein